MLRRTFSCALFSIAYMAMWGCAQTKSHPQDPYEVFNRATFNFNKTIDKVAVKPVAYVYLKYMPQPFQLGIGNFFDNLREITNVANDLLQFQFAYAAHDTSRFLINSTLGIGGIFDPASSLGLEHRKEDFGQTLYQWGYHNSSYLVLPFLGPSTFRDTIGLGVDYYGLSVWPWIDSDWQKYVLIGVDYLDIRARLLRKESVLDILAVDEYVFMRDAYFQHRQYLFNADVHDAAHANPYDDIGPDEDIELSNPTKEKAVKEKGTKEKAKETISQETKTTAVEHKKEQEPKSEVKEPVKAPEKI